MEANLRKCLITTRQSLFCVLFFGLLLYNFTNSKNKTLFKKQKSGNYETKNFYNTTDNYLKNGTFVL
ncbi:hypothetical protein DB891_02465 [Flavobacterium laiguense]|uniref:Uncharacterized protein n=1 Tax=Flavobacterium laiguense TaxID=2169409 RepID=A0A2U1K2F4_9FLAO|nr:hypothetical protein DB891_02465 [Flavobacterium laiguense]